MTMSAQSRRAPDSPKFESPALKQNGAVLAHEPVEHGDGVEADMEREDAGGHA